MRPGGRTEHSSGILAIERVVRLVMPEVQRMRRAGNILPRLAQILYRCGGLDNHERKRAVAWRTEPVLYHLIALEK
jgi:hypothetical protein